MVASGPDDFVYRKYYPVATAPGSEFVDPRQRPVATLATPVSSGALVLFIKPNIKEAAAVAAFQAAFVVVYPTPIPIAAVV